MKEVDLKGSRLEEEYKGEDYVVVVGFENVIENMFYIEDKYRVKNSDGNIDINVLGLLKDKGINVNDLIGNGRGVWFGKCEDWVFRVMNRVV